MTTVLCSVAPKVALTGFAYKTRVRGGVPRKSSGPSGCFVAAPLLTLPISVPIERLRRQRSWDKGFHLEV
jgi:hypothetical protein